MKPILIVEGNKTIDSIKLALKRAGYLYDCAETVEMAERCFFKERYALALIDNGMPGLIIGELMAKARRCRLPVILMAEKSEARNMAQGLLMGVDDYLFMPFETDELLMRIDAVQKRHEKGKAVLQVLDVSVDTEKRKVLKNGETVILTPKEYDLLLFLITHQNDVLYRELMFKQVWNEDFMGCSRTLDLHIQRLRKKLGWQQQIKTIYRVGYQLEVS